MARNDLVLQLVKSGVAGDRDASRRVAEALVADERSKQRSALAERLEGVLKAAPRAAPVAPREDIVGLQIKLPDRTLDTICLSDINRVLIEEFIEEQDRSDLLRSHGMEPRHTMLLVGAPGVGKTSLAEAIATALSLPLHTVKYDTLVGSYLGETSARLRRVFDHARTNPCVLFFDEFDAIGKERGDASDVGELKRVVASLLTQIDDMPATSVAICATNHPELLDSAAWRRFELRLTLELPDAAELAGYFQRFAASLEEPLGVAPSALAEALAGASYADAEAFCDDAKRRSILSLGAKPMKQIVETLLERRQARAPIQRVTLQPAGKPAPRKKRESAKTAGETVSKPKGKKKHTGKRPGGSSRKNARSSARPPSST
ncbi:MAG: ATP-binding protein [Hyphomonadaceae bacterium]|nr:ATP-binding protein [Hyphomonadaceae bacterium]